MAGPAALARLTPPTIIIPGASRLARVYHAGGRHPMTWNAFRHAGPLIYYAARDAKTVLGEAFQGTRRIDRAFRSPWLVVFATTAPLSVLDLTGDLATCSGSREQVRGWARDLYEAFKDIQGIQYASSMNGGAAALAFNERALKLPLFAAHPLFHRALADDVMLDPLKHAAQALGYALR